MVGGADAISVADWLRSRTRQPYFALSGLSMLPATFFAVLAITLHGSTAIAAAALLSQFFLWFYNGPINALLANAVPASMVARAFSLSILCIHLLGDAISPPIIGAVSDLTSLPAAVGLVPATMAVGALVWLWGWRKIPELDPA